MIFQPRFRSVFVFLLVAIAFIFGAPFSNQSKAQTLFPTTGNDTSDIAWLGLQAPGNGEIQSFSSIATSSGSFLRIQNYNGKVVGDGNPISSPLSLLNTNGAVFTDLNLESRVIVTGTVRFEDSTIGDILVGPSSGGHIGLLYPNGALGEFGSQRIELLNTHVTSNVRLLFRPDLLVLNNSSVAGQVLLGSGDDVLVLEGVNQWNQSILLEGDDDWVIDRGGLLANTIDGGNERTQIVPIENYGDAYLYFGVKKEHQDSQILGFERFSLVYGADIDLSKNNSLNSNFFYIDPTSTARFGDQFEISLANNGSGAFTKSLLSNDGVISLQTGLANGRLKINGDYTSSGAGKLQFDVDIAARSSDVLEVTGDTSGSTEIEFENTGGTIDPFAPVNILAVEVGGNSDGVFTTAGVKEVPYEYQLVKESDGDWYLRNVFRNGLPSVNAGIPSVLSALGSSSFAAESGFSVFRNRMDSIRTNSRNTGGCCRGRFGLGWCGDSESCRSRQANFWYQNHYTDLKSRLRSGAAFDSDRNETFVGADWIDHQNSFSSSSIAFGVFGKFGNGELDFNGRTRNFSAATSELGIDSSGVGFYASMFDEITYTDLLFQYQRDRFNGSSLRDTATDTYLASLSGGYTLLQSQQWTLSPEGRILVSNSRITSLDSSLQNFFNPTVDDFDSVLGQIGVKLDRNWNRFGVNYTGSTRLAYQYEFLGDTGITIGSFNETIDYSGSRVALQTGLKGNIGRHLSLQSQVGAFWANSVYSFGAGLGVTYHR